MAEPLGLLGGTFDPVHYGHLRLAEEAREALRLAQVAWIPAGRPPHRAPPCAAAIHRLEMVRLAVAGNDGFLVDDGEVRADAPSFTVVTLERLRAQMPRRPLVLLLGADAFLGLPTWHRWEQVLELAHLGVAARPGFPLQPNTWPEALAQPCAGRFGSDAGVLRQSPAGRIVGFDMTPLPVSASGLRARLAAGRSARYLLPDAVREYIERHHLY
ncbi:MAG TPA: nicotinate-nucleotide adenylyltransferase [Candidatus Desulfobacillus sp.]|nr:nicotinate-nucleotide adenylyltransferase [Candidatus Desulfobacillus sp.]